jgi:2-desacetyl-2-hydroxyethyl bacteriochlorophyllide A dehydrogenase
MRAISLSRPETLLPITLPEPAAPGPDQALVAVRAVGICGTDFSGYLGSMPFIDYPRILGHELGVEILSVGAEVQDLRSGDRCSVEPYLHCGHCHACRQGKTNCCESLEVLGVHRDGGLCQRLLLPASKLHRSTSLSFDQLALVETLGIGCHAVERAALTPTDDVIIIGAGPIGLAVLEFARLKTSQIRVIELNPDRRQFVSQHYPGIELLESAAAANEHPAQVIFDATGHPDSMAGSLTLARFTGRLIFVGITKSPVLLDDPLFHRRELTLLASRNALSSDFPKIIRLIEQGTIDTSHWMTHRGQMDALPDLMPQWLLPASRVVKAIVNVE